MVLFFNIFGSVLYFLIGRQQKTNTNPTKA
jgi:preprotein translocase subunit YajC